MFRPTIAEFHWSGTSESPDATFALGVNFGVNFVTAAHAYKDYAVFSVRAVRAGL
jgi:hypothetical protein